MDESTPLQHADDFKQQVEKLVSGKLANVSLQDDKVNAEVQDGEALEIATLTKDDPAKAHALELLGEVYRAQSQEKQAEKAFVEAHAIHVRMGNDLGAANALLSLGDTIRIQSRNSEAENALLDAHAIYFRIGNDLGIANALSGLASVYSTQSRSNEAGKLLQEATQSTHALAMTSVLQTLWMG